MRALNVLLSVLISLAMCCAVLEGGLRLIGFGPPESITQFDSQLGWKKRANASVRRSTREFDIEDGAVDGNSFSFSMTLSFGDNSFTQEYSGTFDGDSMEGQIAGGGRGGRGGGPRPFTGKRGG